MSMKTAYTTGAKVFEQVTRHRNPRLADDLAEIEQGEIAVVSGDHDHVELLLDQMKIKFATYDPEELPDVKNHRVMFVNCRDYDKSEVPKKRVRDFVDNGGRLVTTDWALSLVTAAFPGKLYHTKDTDDDVVEVRAQNYLARSMIGLNYTQCHPKWWLEGASYVYRTGQGVVDLITSEEMKRKYGQNHVAVGFQSGKGDVFHFISHLELQRTHQRESTDKGTIDDFLKNMNAAKTKGMYDANVAELEAAFSTLNTLAYLCSRGSLLQFGGEGDGRSYMPRTDGGKKSKSLI